MNKLKKFVAALFKPWMSVNLFAFWCYVFISHSNKFSGTWQYIIILLLLVVLGWLLEVWSQQPKPKKIWIYSSSTERMHGFCYMISELPKDKKDGWVGFEEKIK